MLAKGPWQASRLWRFLIWDDSSYTSQEQPSRVTKSSTARRAKSPREAMAAWVVEASMVPAVTVKCSSSSWASRQDGWRTGCAKNFAHCSHNKQTMGQRGWGQRSLCSHTHWPTYFLTPAHQKKLDLPENKSDCLFSSPNENKTGTYFRGNTLLIYQQIFYFERCSFHRDTRQVNIFAYKNSNNMHINVTLDN